MSKDKDPAEIIGKIMDAIKAAGIDAKIELAAVDKPEPDGEDAQSVINRVFKRALENPPYPVTAIAFGRVVQGNAFGLYESEDRKHYAVLVACGGDAHYHNFTEVFASREAAQTYISSDFDQDVRDRLLDSEAEAATNSPTQRKAPTIN